MMMGVRAAVIARVIRNDEQPLYEDINPHYTHPYALSTDSSQ